MTAVGLNFRDVLNVLGLYPGDPGDPGGDCAGTVAAVGSAAAAHHRYMRTACEGRITPIVLQRAHPVNWSQCVLLCCSLNKSKASVSLLTCLLAFVARVGDVVFGQATGCLGTAVIADAATLVPSPAPLALEQAATVPTVFLTADACLRQSCTLGAGQRVLIHAATGAFRH